MREPKVVHLLCDDEQTCQSLQSVLRTGGFTVRAHLARHDFPRNAQEADAGCVVLDMPKSDPDGFRIMADIASRRVEMPVVVTGDRDVFLAVQAMKAGAFDFICRPVETALLLDAVQRSFLQIEHASIQAAERAQARHLLTQLTPREADVLAGMAFGYSNRTIACDIGLSSRTVEIHRASLMRKLGVQTTAEALRIAFAAGLPKMSCISLRRQTERQMPQQDDDIGSVRNSGRQASG